MASTLPALRTAAQEIGRRVHRLLQKRRIRTYRAERGRYALLRDAAEGERVLSEVFPRLNLDPAEVFAAV